MKAFLCLSLVAVLCLFALPSPDVDACSGGSGGMMMSGGCSSGSCGMSSMGMHANMGMRSMRTTTMMAGYNSGAGRMGFLARMRERRSHRGMMAAAPAVVTTTVEEVAPVVQVRQQPNVRVIVVPADEFNRRSKATNDCSDCEKQSPKATLPPANGIQLSPGVAPARTRFVSLNANDVDEAPTLVFFDVDF